MLVVERGSGKRLFVVDAIGFILPSSLSLIPVAAVAEGGSAVSEARAIHVFLLDGYWLEWAEMM